LLPKPQAAALAARAQRVTGLNGRWQLRSCWTGAKLADLSVSVSAVRSLRLSPFCS